MAIERRGNIVGCLFIDDIVGDGQPCSVDQWIPGAADIEAHPFQWGNAGGMWNGLQAALHRVRTQWGECGIVARASGCAAALALAEQLPVERLVLIEPALPKRPDRMSPRSVKGETPANNSMACRQARRLAAFARRNLTLCVSEVLLISREGGGREGAALGPYGRAVNCRVQRLCLSGKTEKELYTIREFAVKPAISCFLRTGELPKPLAENGEMCIIYG